MIETNDGFYFVYEDVDRDKTPEYVAKIVHRPSAVMCADWCWLTDFGSHHIRHISPNVLYDEGTKFFSAYIHTGTGNTMLDFPGYSETLAPWLNFTGYASSFNGDVVIAISDLNEVYYDHDGEWRLLSERLGFTGALPDFSGDTELVATNDAVWIVNNQLSGDSRTYQVFPLSSRAYGTGEKIHQMIPDSHNGGAWALMGKGLYFFPKDGEGWNLVVENLMDGTGLEEFGLTDVPFRMAQDEAYIYTNFFKAIKKNTGTICRFINRDAGNDTFEDFQVMNSLYNGGPVSVNDGYGEIYFLYNDTSKLATLRRPVSHIAVTVSSFKAGCPEWEPAY